MLNIKADFKIIVAILIVSVILGFSYNFFREDGLPLLKKKETIETVSIDRLKNDNKKVQALKVDEIYNLFEKNKIIIIDARDEWDFKDGHIKNAINIPEYNFEAHKQKLDEFNKTDLFVVYCADPECGLSKKLVEKLHELGFEKSYIFQGGWFKWLEKGYPIEMSVDNE